MLASRVLTGAAWLLAGRFITSLVGFASTLIVARLLVPEQFGLMAIAAGVGAVLGALVDLPTGVALVQMKDVEDKDYDTAWTLGVLKGLIVAVLTALCAYPVAEFSRDPRVFWLLLAMAGYPLILGFRNAHFESYARRIDFRREILLDLLAKLSSLIVAVSVAVSLRNVWALAAGQLASAVVTVLLSFILVPKRPTFSLGSFSRIFGFTSWLALSQIFSRISYQSDPLIVGRSLGAAVLGQVSVGNQVVYRFLDPVVTSVFRSLMSGFSRIQDDDQRSRAGYLSSQALISAFLLPAPLGLAAIAGPLTPLLLGPGWEMTAPVITAYGLVTGIGIIAIATPPLLIARGQTRRMFYRDLLTVLVRIPLVLAGAASGFDGLLVSLVAAEIGVTIISMYLVKLEIGIGFAAQLLNVGRSLLSAASMFLVVQALAALPPPAGVAGPWIAIAGLCAVGAAVYAATHLALWVLAGRPPGPEARSISIIRSAIARTTRPPH